MLHHFKLIKLGIVFLLASAGLADASTFGLNDITDWSYQGSSTASYANEAAMVIQWNAPVVFNNTSVPAPSQNLELVFGYKFNGTANAGTMMDAIVANNPNLYVINSGGSFAQGAFIYGFGYHTDSSPYAVTDGSTTYTQSSFQNGVLDTSVNDNFNADTFYASDPKDVYWGGFYGPSWQLWTEEGDNGGFLSEPDRGPSPYWTTTDGFDGSQGQWDFAQEGVSSLTMTNGSWIGWTVSGGGYDGGDNPGTSAFLYDAQAPALISVPEPASLGLLLPAAVGLLPRRRARP